MVFMSNSQPFVPMCDGLPSLSAGLDTLLHRLSKNCNWGGRPIRNVGSSISRAGGPVWLKHLDLTISASWLWARCDQPPHIPGHISTVMYCIPKVWARRNPFFRNLLLAGLLTHSLKKSNKHIIYEPNEPWIENVQKKGCVYSKHILTISCLWVNAEHRVFM